MEKAKLENVQMVHHDTRMLVYEIQNIVADELEGIPVDRSSFNSQRRQLGQLESIVLEILTKLNAMHLILETIRDDRDDNEYK
jgi:hypothetical protein